MLTALSNEEQEVVPIIFGTMHFINKSSVITESDEIILTTFVDFISSILLNSKYIHDIFEKSQLLGHLLESSTTVYDVIPDHHNIAFTPSRLRIQPKEILIVVERIFYNILKVSKVRVLLVSNQMNQEDHSRQESSYRHHQFVYLDPYAYKTPKTQSLLSSDLNSGIAGHVYQTKDFHIFDFNSPQSHDERLNPLVDLEPLLGGYLLCLPVISLAGNIMAVIELIHGANSPVIKANSADSQSNSSDQIDFLQASLWLVHQITPPLEYLMSHIDKSIKRPMSPGSITNSMIPSPRAHNESFPVLSATVVQSTASTTSLPAPSVTEFIRSPSFSAMKSATLVSQRTGSKQKLSTVTPITSMDQTLIRQPTTTADYQSRECFSPKVGRSNTNSSMMIEPVTESPVSTDGKIKDSLPHILDAHEEFGVYAEEQEALQTENQKLRSENADLILEVERLTKLANRKRDPMAMKDRKLLIEELTILPTEPAPRITRPVTSRR